MRWCCLVLYLYLSVLLTLQAEYPAVKCFAYAPPGATLCRALARAVSSFVTSVVIGKDMVPRLSLPNVHALLGDVVSRSPLDTAFFNRCDLFVVCIFVCLFVLLLHTRENPC